ncbi:S-layer homology domain-containing protein [Candidatus Peregrinibacteria bacterium]|nr:MAG: S-layer homology domain-containing protein [Candidatus Peregrinibacteria bacterium]
MKNAMRFLGLIGFLFVFSLWVLAADSAPFSDVPTTHPYADDIAELKALGVLQGNPDGTYRPSDTLNRAEMTKILAEAAIKKFGMSEDTFDPYAARSCFPDVPAQIWFTKYVCFAEEHGWVQGYSDGTFRPNRAVSHAEGIKIAFKAFGIAFDETLSPWYTDVIAKARELNYLAPTYTSPTAPLNRGEMASVTVHITDSFTATSSPQTSNNSSAPSSTHALNSCGNGKIDSTEVCDSSALGSPLCNANCSARADTTGNSNSNSTPTTPPSSSTPAATSPQKKPDPTYCGNKEIDPNEVCDGSIPGSPACNSTCTAFASSTTGSSSTPATPSTPTPPLPPYVAPVVAVSGQDTPNSCNVSNYGLTGSTYYFCDCAAGSYADCKSGDSSLTSSVNPLLPARSIANAFAQFNSMPAGSTVALCRGGAFDANAHTLFNQKCTAANRCRLTDYTPYWASGDEKRPLVNANATALEFSDGGDSDQDGGYVVTNINFKMRLVRALLGYLPLMKWMICMPATLCSMDLVLTSTSPGETPPFLPVTEKVSASPWRIPKF